MDARRVLVKLAAPGFRLEPDTFTPRSSPAAPQPKYDGVACAGLRVRPEGPGPIRGYELGLALLHRLRAEPRFVFLREGAALDTLLGTRSVREALERGETAEAIARRDEGSSLAFRREREAILLY
jgi:hypothetical protein